LTFVGNGTIPVGGIIMWSGTIAAIPTGWALCDGNNGTPNLVNRFVMAAGNLYGVGEFGGATSNRLTPMNIPPHKHTIPQSYNANQGGGSTITYVGMGQPPQISPGNASIYNSDNVLQTAQGNNPEQFSILNPYYALAYIMRTT
jgi:microcystin-dependent protein